MVIEWRRLRLRRRLIPIHPARPSHSSRWARRALHARHRPIRRHLRHLISGWRRRDAIWCVGGRDGAVIASQPHSRLDASVKHRAAHRVPILDGFRISGPVLRGERRHVDLQPVQDRNQLAVLQLTSLGLRLVQQIHHQLEVLATAVVVLQDLREVDRLLAHQRVLAKAGMVEDAELEDGRGRHQHGERVVPFGQICVLLDLRLPRRVCVDGQLHIRVGLQERMAAQWRMFDCEKQAISWRSEADKAQLTRYWQLVETLIRRCPRWWWWWFGHCVNLIK